jgi:hypothetical protein
MPHTSSTPAQEVHMSAVPQCRPRIKFAHPVARGIRPGGPLAGNKWPMPVACARYGGSPVAGGRFPAPVAGGRIPAPVAGKGFPAPIAAGRR